jgi:homoserine dehydrogenase
VDGAAAHGGGAVSARPVSERHGERTVRVGLIGCGTVGAAVIRLLHDRADAIATRSRCRIEVVRVAVRDADRDRGVPIDRNAFTADAESVVDDPGVDVICELIGGIEPARSLILRAFGNGKPVVTANKELLANAGHEVSAAADEAGVDLASEAAVAGGIPLIRPLKESLAGEQVHRVLGIVNGTTNYILTQMSDHGSSFDEALAEARRLGYAEADVTADVEGFDAAAKVAILASIAFDTTVVAGDVYREGIARVTPQDIADADRLGYVVKLLAIAELEDGDISVRVHPAMIPSAHPLASVRDAFNAVFVEGERIGQLMFYGPGAGGDPTATAVVGDLVQVARHLVHGGRGVGETATQSRRLRPMGDSRGQYYLNLHVEDRPGVLAEIAERFGHNGVSIERVWQEGFGDEATLVFITHRAQEGAFQKTVAELRELEGVHAVASLLRVEGEEG